MAARYRMSDHTLYNISYHDSAGRTHTVYSGYKYQYLIYTTDRHLKRNDDPCFLWVSTLYECSQDHNIYIRQTDIQEWLNWTSDSV